MTARFTESQLSEILQKGVRNGVRVHGDPPKSTPCSQESTLDTPAPGPTKFDKSEEKKLQSVCRNWLLLHGYYELTASNAEMVRAKLDANPGATYGGSNKGLFHIKGWFGHLSKPIGNAFLPDIFIFNPNMSECLMVELKTRNHYQPGQKAMIGWAWVECRDEKTFIDTLAGWEQRK